MTILKPEGYLGNNNHVKRFTMVQGEAMLGRTVSIFDWYGEIHGATVTALHPNEETGMLRSVSLTLKGGKHVPEFAMNLVSEVWA